MNSLFSFFSLPLLPMFHLLFFALLSLHVLSICSYFKASLSSSITFPIEYIWLFFHLYYILKVLNLYHLFSYIYLLIFLKSHTWNTNLYIFPSLLFFLSLKYFHRLAGIMICKTAHSFLYPKHFPKYFNFSFTPFPNLWKNSFCIFVFSLFLPHPSLSPMFLYNLLSQLFCCSFFPSKFLLPFPSHLHSQSFSLRSNFLSNSFTIILFFENWPKKLKWISKSSKKD